VEIETETLRELVDLARITASGANLQPLKYVLSNDPVRNGTIFEHLAWAGYLKDWPGPAEEAGTFSHDSGGGFAKNYTPLPETTVVDYDVPPCSRRGPELICRS